MLYVLLWVLILSDNCHLSLLAATMSCMWVVDWVDYFNVIKWVDRKWQPIVAR